jgi:hypothetical protein
MKYTLLSVAAFALFATAATARDFQGECVNIVANYENAAPTKCVFYDSNTSETKVPKKVEAPKPDEDEDEGEKPKA